MFASIFRVYARQTWHFFYLMLFKQRKACSLWGDAYWKLRCIKATNISGLSYGCHNYQAQENIFSDTPNNDALCFASVLSTEMEEGWIVGNVRQGNHHSFFFYQTHKENKDDKREQGILINNSGFRAINRQYWIFRTLGGWSQLRWRRTGS